MSTGPFVVWSRVGIDEWWVLTRESGRFEATAKGAATSSSLFFGTLQFPL